MLEVTGITVRFGDRTVLNRVDLHVPTGQICCLTGASGSGKSTLLRVIAGLQRPDAGTVTLDGVDITVLPTHRRDIGLVFQDHALFPHLDVADNIGFALRVRRRDPRQRRTRVDELLDLVGLSSYGAHRVSELSGGEQQRVALARALAAEPRVLLLDEPLGALDPEIHDRLAADLRMLLHGSGTTAIHVTHDRLEAALVGDRTIDITEINGNVR